MRERRKHKRLAVSTPVKWRIKKRADRNYTDAFLIDTHNITKRGVFLKTALRPRKGAPVELEIHGKKDTQPIKLQGRVIWIARQKTHPHLYPGIGIKFENINREDFKKLSMFLRNKFLNFQDAVRLKNMYLQLKMMASRLVELEERHTSAAHFKEVIENAIKEIDDVAHMLDKEINEIKRL